MIEWNIFYNYQTIYSLKVVILTGNELIIILQYTYIHLIIKNPDMNV